jgi:hypothetical protein
MLTAFGFVVGPFVYLGHEMAWDRFGAAGKRAKDALARLPSGPPEGVEQGA